VMWELQLPLQTPVVHGYRDNGFSLFSFVPSGQM